MDVSFEVKGVSISAKDINIPSPVLNNINQTLIKHDITKQRLSKYAKEQLSPIKKLAYEYLVVLNDCIITIQDVIIAHANAKQASVKLQQGTDGSVAGFIFNLAKLKRLRNLLSNKTRVVENKTDEFSNQLKIMMEKVPVLTYTHTTAKSSITDIYVIDNLNKILRIERQSKGLNQPRLRSNLSKLQGLLLQQDNRFNQYILSGDSLNNLQTTYKQILYRWTTNIYNHTPSHFILWNMGKSYGDRSNWKGLWLEQRGDIVQTYQRAVFTRNQSFNNNFDDVPQNNINIFMELLTDPINGVNASSGLLESDIEVEINGILYSISAKASGAEPQNIPQAIKLASDILNATDLTEKNVKQWLEQYNNQNLKDNSVRQSIINITDEYLQNQLRK